MFNVSVRPLLSIKSRVLLFFNEFPFLRLWFWRKKSNPTLSYLPPLSLSLTLSLSHSLSLTFSLWRSSLTTPTPLSLFFENIKRLIWRSAPLLFAFNDNFPSFFFWRTSSLVELIVRTLLPSTDRRFIAPSVIVIGLAVYLNITSTFMLMWTFCSTLLLPTVA